MKVLWAEGYLSALNEQYPGVDVLDKIDADVIGDWIDAFCEKYPRSSIQDAAAALFAKLGK